jgi:hypothetical protein
MDGLHRADRVLTRTVSVGGDHSLCKAREPDPSVSTSNLKSTTLPQSATFSSWHLRCRKSSSSMLTPARNSGCVTERHFPPPWFVEEHPACFIVRDHSGPAHQAAKLLTKDEARRIATNFARLPELLRSQPQ